MLKLLIPFPYSGAFVRELEEFRDGAHLTGIEFPAHSGITDVCIERRGDGHGGKV